MASSSIDAGELFAVKGLVAVVTGGGTGRQIHIGPFILQGIWISIANLPAAGIGLMIA